MEEEIIASGWPVGKVLGSEAELIERYGVSRAVFREAMRIVDHHGVAEMRRGPGGGLVVVAPKADAAVRTLSLNLEYLDLTPKQINEARLAIELIGEKKLYGKTVEGVLRSTFVVEETARSATRSTTSRPRGTSPSCAAISASRPEPRRV